MTGRRTALPRFSFYGNREKTGKSVSARFRECCRQDKCASLTENDLCGILGSPDIA